MLRPGSVLDPAAANTKLGSAAARKQASGRRAALIALPAGARVQVRGGESKARQRVCHFGEPTWELVVASRELQLLTSSAKDKRRLFPPRPLGSFHVADSIRQFPGPLTLLGAAA